MPDHEFHPPRNAGEADPRRWVAFAILLLASFMNLMDVTVVNVAIPSMQQNLGASSSQIEWVVAAYVLAFALGLLPFGRLGDIVGRREMFLVGVGLFTLGSFLCGIAPNIETLIGARVLQGMAGAVMTPQVPALAQVIFPPEERGLAFSMFGLSSGLASVAGPVLGGLLVGGNFWGMDWRPIFLINIPFGIFAVLAGLALIIKVPPHKGLRNDFFGIGLFGVAMLMLVFPLIEGRSYGWPMWAFAMMLGSSAVMAAFFFWERHRVRVGGSQLLPFSLLTNRNFLLGMAMTVLFASAIPGFFLTFAIYLQTGFGLTPLQAGLTGVPFSVGVVLSSYASGRLGSRYLSQRFAAGMGLLALGLGVTDWVIATGGTQINSQAFTLPLLIAGGGLGIGIAALFQMILAGVPHKDAGSGSGALQAFQQAGNALGVAISGEIFFTWLDNAKAWGATSKQAGFTHAATAAVLYSIIACLLAAGLVPLLRRGARADAKDGDANETVPLIVET